MLVTFRKFINLLFHIIIKRKLIEKRGRFCFSKKRLFWLCFYCFDFVLMVMLLLSHCTRPTASIITPEYTVLEMFIEQFPPHPESVKPHIKIHFFITSTFASPSLRFVLSLLFSKESEKRRNIKTQL